MRQVERIEFNPGRIGGWVGKFGWKLWGHAFFSLYELDGLGLIAGAGFSGWFGFLELRAFF
jgi:hypothetical protein